MSRRQNNNPENNNNNSNNNGKGYIQSLPKSLIKIIQFLYSLDVKEAVDLFKAIIYLWREYYILTSIKPVIKEYIVSFTYKKETLINCRVKTIKDILKIVNELRISKGVNIDD